MFNVYQTTGCNVGWSQLNTLPLAIIESGTIGVTSIGLVSNQLYAIINNTPAVINAYQYNGTAQ